MDWGAAQELVKGGSVLIREWWQARAIHERQTETDRKATSVELSGILPDGTKFAVKEYARDSGEAYRIALETVTKARRDFAK